MQSLARLAFVFAVGLTGCTVTTTSKEPGGGSGDPNGTPASSSGDGQSSGSPGTSSGGGSTASTVPAELAGTSWTWTTSSGAHHLAFEIGGSYESDVFLNAHPGDSCGTEYFTHHAGKVTFEADKFTLRSSIAERTKSDSCKDQVLSKDTIDPFVTTYQWRIGDDGTGREALILTDEASPDSPSQYYRDEQ